MSRLRLSWVVGLVFAACTTEPSNSDASASESESTESTESTGNEQLIDDYCTCMLFKCHLHYHDEWGESEIVARETCFEVAAQVPVAGEPITEGNALECRLAFCEMSSGEDDPAVCPAALGAAPCAE